MRPQLQNMPNPTPDLVVPASELPPTVDGQDVYPTENDVTPLPETVLDPEETPYVSAPNAETADDPNPHYAAEIRFRHSGWHRQRLAIVAALTRCSCPERRLAAFVQCGSNAWVMRDVNNPARLALASQKCHDRFCVPCAKERARIVASNLRDKLPNAQLRFLTLTMKSSDEPLAVQLTRLRKCFQRFRNDKRIKPLMAGGLSFLEITLSEKLHQWHPHLHIVFEGKYLPHDLASLVWHEITTDSYIVHIRAVTGNDTVREYLAHYLSVGVNASVWRDTPKLDELIKAMAGTRTIAAFGTWRTIGLARSPLSDTTWEPVARLSDLLLASRAGDREAINLLRSLTNAREPNELSTA